MRFRSLIGVFGALAASTLLPAGGHAQWSDLGLSGREVTRLRSSDGLLYACTYDGLHRKASDTADSAWVLLGFAGQRVLDVLAVSPETLIVAREITATGADTVALYRSTDGGANWSPFQNGLGAVGSLSSRRVTVLLGPPGAPGTVLAATLSGIFRSTNGGLSWIQVSLGGKYEFLAAGASTFWGGGESTALTPFVRRSTDGGVTWSTSFTSGTDNVAKSMGFDPSNPDVAYLGTSGPTIYRTSNNGVSWTPVPPSPGAGASILASRAFPPMRLYAHGFVAPGGATIVKTDDEGATWTPVTFAGAASSSILTLLVHSGPAADTVFLGMGAGVLRYVEQELVGVDLLARESCLDLGAHPNPFRAGTTLTFRLPRASRVSLRMLDPMGREVATLLRGLLEAGSHRLAWDSRTLPSGAYFCELRVGGEVATRKLCIFR